MIGVPRAAVAQGRGPVEVEQRGSRAGSTLPAEEGAAFIYLIASQRDAMRPPWSGVVELFRDLVAPASSVMWKRPLVQSSEHFRAREVWPCSALVGSRRGQKRSSATGLAATRATVGWSIFQPSHANRLQSGVT